MMENYLDFVAFQCQLNPCLSNLRSFLNSQTAEGFPSRVCCLSYLSDNDEVVIESLEKASLTTAICGARHSDEKLQGRILLIEDPDKDVVQTLGRVLRVDPVFFASHLESTKWDMSYTAPESALPPSRSRTEQYVNIHYQRVLVQQDITTKPQQLLTISNVKRKVNILPEIYTTSLYGAHRVALTQQCCSILRTTLADGTWLCIALLDPPIKTTFHPNKGSYHDNELFRTSFSLFYGGYEDFSDPLLNGITVPQALRRQSMLEDILYYWARSAPPGLSRNDPYLLPLCYFPLRIIVGEWMIYLTLLHHSIRHYEYSVDDLEGDAVLSQNNKRLGLHLKTLHSWRRRAMTSHRRIHAVIQFLSSCNLHRRAEGHSKVDATQMAVLEKDFTHIRSEIQTYGSRLDGILPTITSMVQIVDSRRSLAETANVTRLTYLAMLFVPLSFTASLFSMNTEIAPGSRGFWIYFCVAIPLTLVSFLATLLPVSRIIQAQRFFDTRKMSTASRGKKLF